MKSQCHTGMKLAPVRVFTCKHPLRLMYTARRPLALGIYFHRVDTNYVSGKKMYRLQYINYPVVTLKSESYLPNTKLHAFAYNGLPDLSIFIAG